MRLTARGWMLAALALAFYLFANQTQVGWLYVFSALTAGLWFAAFFWPQRQLRHLGVTRFINGSAPTAEMELYAGQKVQVDLAFANPARWPALQIAGAETCPLAPAAERAQPFFIPYLSARSTLTLTYTVTAHRRGLFSFPAVGLSTRAPFGLVAAQRTLATPTDLIVFPEYRALKRLALLDRAPAPQSTWQRVGMTGEFVGVREYRSGDSRRHVHWRATARVGRLIVKEFAEETQPGLTIALDLRAASALPAANADDSSLELAIKIAATLAHYAQARGLTVHLATNNAQWPVPPGPLSKWGLMNYLARVTATGTESFAQCLQQLPTTSFVAALCPAPDADVVWPLTALRQRGVGVLAVVIDPRAYAPDDIERATATQRLMAELQAQQVGVCRIGAEAHWEETLENS